MPFTENPFGGSRLISEGEQTPTPVDDYLKTRGKDLFRQSVAYHRNNPWSEDEVMTALHDAYTIVQDSGNTPEHFKVDWETHVPDGLEERNNIVSVLTVQFSSSAPLANRLRVELTSKHLEYLSPSHSISISRLPLTEARVRFGTSWMVR